MEDMTAHFVSAAHNYMVQSIKDGRFDGKLNKAGVPQITPRPTKAEKDSNEEESEEV